MPTVLEEMPKFKERESTLLNKLKEKTEGVNVDAEAAKVARVQVLAEKERQEQQQKEKEQQRASLAAAAQPNLLGDYAPQQPAPASSTGPSAVDENAQPPNLTPELVKNLAPFVFNPDGKLYEDAVLQIGVKTSIKGNLARLALYFGNKSGYSITDLSTRVFASNVKDSLVIQAKPIDSTLAPKAQAVQMLNIECLKEFDQQPILGLAYSVNNSSQRVVLKLPIFTCRFFAGFEMDQQTFVSRWKQLSGPGLESQKIIKASTPINLANLRTQVSVCFLFFVFFFFFNVNYYWV